MPEKLTYYDVIAHLVPGTIFCVFIYYMLYVLGIVGPKVDLGSLGTLGIGIAIAYTVGHLLQAIASTLEPFYFWIWGGKPSVRLLEHASREFSEQQRLSLVDTLIVFFSIGEKCPSDRKTARHFYQRLFDKCMSLCNRNGLGRVENFNAAYGFHRVLLTVFVTSFLAYLTIWIAAFWGKLTLPHAEHEVLRVLLLLTALGALIEIFRARKRGHYFAREILWMTSDYIRTSGGRV